jgi:hypothetical protein
MNRTLVRVLVFAVAGTAIGYAMQQGYKSFARLDEPWRLLGYLSVFATTGFAIVGMASFLSLVSKRAKARA